MKLSPVALSILLSTPSWTSAFSPTSFGAHTALRSSFHEIPLPHTFPIQRPYPNYDPTTCAITSLSMVGGGMIERPPGSEDDSNEDDDDDDDTEPLTTSTLARERGLTGPGSLSPRGDWQQDAEAKIMSLYGDDEDAIDPYNPNVPISPRPGKYGWKKEKETKAPTSEEELVQNMSASEREENLNIIRSLRINDIPILWRIRDWQGHKDATLDLETRMNDDPWFELNERLRDAIHLDQPEEATKMRAWIDKIGGPPPQLEKYVNVPNSSGYIKYKDIYEKPLTTEQLERIIERKRREESRKEMLKVAEERKKRSLIITDDGPSLEDIASEKMKNYIARIGRDNEAELMETKLKLQEEQKAIEEKRQETLKQFGGEEPDVESINKAFMEKSMQESIGDIKRLVSEFEDEDDFGAVGGSAAERALSSGTGGEGDEYADRPMSNAARARAEAMKNDGNGRPRLPGDADVTRGELEATLEVNESSSTTTGPLTVEVTSAYNSENSDPPMRKHCFQYTVRITNNSQIDTVQLLSRRFEIQTVGASMKDVVQGDGVTGRQPVLKPGEVFEYTSTAPLSVRPIGTTQIAARMSGEYRYCTLKDDQDKATDEQVNKGQGEAGAELAMFHFVFPEEQRVKPVRPSDDDDDEDEEESGKTTVVASSKSSSSSPPSSAADASPTTTSSNPTPASSLPGDPSITSGTLTNTPNDSSDTLTSDVRVVVTSTYRPERSDAKLDKHCFAYNVRIVNEKSSTSIQLVSRRFEIQTVGSTTKDVVQGPGVTGRQPVLKPGETFEYTSTAPLSVKPMLDKTQVVAKMSGEYNFVELGEDGVTPLSSTPVKAELGGFHFILPE